MLADPRPGSITGFPFARSAIRSGWVVHRHGVLYAQEYGWDEDFEALVAKVAAAYLDGRGTARQAGWIAEADGERVGGVFCMAGPDKRTAQLRLLLVEPSSRGLGVGKRLVAECVDSPARAATPQSSSGRSTCSPRPAGSISAPVSSS
jgi:GNAT superfamily N-acetyltransferase